MPHSSRSPQPDRWFMRSFLLCARQLELCWIVDPEKSGECERRRAAVKLGAQPAGAGGIAAGDTRIYAGRQGGPMSGRGGGYEYRGDGGWYSRRKLLAARRGFDGGARVDGLRRGCLRVHGAMMRAAAAAAKGQACLAVPGQHSGNRRQPEKKNQRNGERSPHQTRFTIMPSTLESRQPQNLVRYDRAIA